MQRPSWEANWFAASQEIPRIFLNPKVHYRTHKRPPPVPVLGQANPVHIPTSHLLEIHPNIIHPSTPRSPRYSLELDAQNCIYVHVLIRILIGKYIATYLSKKWDIAITLIFLIQVCLFLNRAYFSADDRGFGEHSHIRDCYTRMCVNSCSAC